MQIRCPHCQNGVEVVDEIEFNDMACESCGSHFSLVSHPDAETLAPKEQMVDQFRLEQEVGTGAFGTVYKARDTELDRAVALKIPRRLNMAEEEQDQFLREARAAAQLSHPNIVSVHTVGRDGDTLYIVSDFVDGVDLADKITVTRFTPRQSVLLCVKVAAAIEHAHQHGVIHRDLKPSNIMLNSDNEPLVMDFGLAKRDAGEITMTYEGKLLGTPAYMPPEQARGEGHDVDGRADIYSIGVILFELLTGELPFRGSARMLLNQVIHDQPPSPRKLQSAIPKDLETITLKCLEKDPDKRYKSCASLGEDLQAWADHKPIKARPTTWMGRSWRWCKRKPAVAAMSVGILLVLVGATVISTVFAVAATREARAVEVQRGLAESRAVEAKRAQENADEQRRLTQKQKESSDRNFKLAREAVDELTAVSQDELFNLPQTEPVREALLEKAKVFYEKFVGQEGDDPQLMAAMGDAYQRLGQIHYRLGDRVAAITEFERSIRIYDQLVKTHPNVPRYAGSLSSMYVDMARVLFIGGQTDEVIGFYTKAILIKEQLAKDHPDSLLQANNLAITYGNLSRVQSTLGQTVLAINTINKAILIEEQLVKDHPEIMEYASSLCSSYNQLANVLRKHGKTDEAIGFYKKAILIRKQLVKDHPDILKYASNLSSTYNGLAGVLSDHGKSDESIEIFKKAIRIKEQLVKEHPRVPMYASSLSSSYVDLAGTLRDHGHLDKAIEFFDNAILIKVQLVKDYPDVLEYAATLAISYKTLGMALVGLQEVDEAIHFYKKAILIEEQLVKDHPDIMEYASSLSSSYNDLAAALSDDKGKTDEAIEFYQKCIEIKEKLVKEQPDITEYAISLAKSFYNLGNTLARLRETDKAIESFQKCIEIKEQLVKEQPDITAYAINLSDPYHNLAIQLIYLGQRDKAIELFSKAIPIKERLLIDHPNVRKYALQLLYSYNALSRQLIAIGKTGLAINTINKAIAIGEQRVKDHPDVLDYVVNLSSSYDNMVAALRYDGKTDEAIGFYKKAILIRKQLVKDHPMVPSYANALVSTQVNCGMLEQSQWLFEDAIGHFESSLELLRSLEKRGLLKLNPPGWGQRLVQKIAFCRNANRAIEDLSFVLAQPPAEAAKLLLVRGQVKLDRNDHLAAVESAEELAGLKSSDEQSDTLQANAYNAACLLSLASAAAAKDEELAEAERTALVDKYAARAVALLIEDRSLGYFKDPAKVAHMKKDTDLDPLRERDDFKQFLKELEASATQPDEPASDE